jgi:hypothetical protein
MEDDFNSYYGDDSDDFYAEQNNPFDSYFGDDSDDAAIPIQYDPADQSHAETERLLRQNSDAEGQALIEQAKTNPSLWTYLIDAAKKYGGEALKYAKQAVMTDGKLDFAKLATGIAAISALTGGDKPKSNAYQGSIPTLTATRSQVPYDYVNEQREPGSYGRDYFSDINYSAPNKAGEANAAGATEAQAMKTQNDAVQAAVAAKKLQQEQEQENQQFAMPWQSRQKFAKGGRYLDGHTDGMADKIPSTIDGKQKAALSHGEFVIPADVVSHLGNGNSNAGAQKLYDMMARVRKARTGNQHQGKQINPDKFLAASGGIAGYSDGGSAPDYYGPNFVSEVNEKGEKNYDTQAVVNSTGSTSTGTGTTSSTTIPDQGRSVAEGLSTWAGPYVSGYLGKGQALANTPYQAYKGPLTAGASDLQKQQFSGISNLAKTGFTPGQFNYQGFDSDAAQKYMNPYTQAALDPQIAELNRQGQIQNVQNQYQARKQGGYGGSGAVLAQTENQRNTLDKVQSALGQGYNTAYNNAQQQFNADQNRQLQTGQANEANRQFSANYGLSNLQTLGTAGATQRDIASQGIAADKNQFEEARDFPYKQVQFQKSLLTGLPITTTENTAMQSQLSEIADKIAGLASIYKTLEGLGQTTPTTPPK